MNPAHPGQTRPRSPRALAFLLALAFGFAAFAAGPAAASEDPLIVRRTILGMTWETIPARPCAGQDVALRFMLCECQVDLLDASFDSTRGVVVRLTANPAIVCATCNPDSAIVHLGRFAAGNVAIQPTFLIDYVTSPPDSSWPTSPAHDLLTFSVAPDCPTPGGIPYLERVVIGRPAPCAECPSRVCPGDSIDVLLAGTFPDDCTFLAGVALYPSALMDPLPHPPTIRITYGTHSCLGRPCQMIPQPWATRVRLPEMPHLGGFVYQLPIEGYLHDFCSSDSIGQFLAQAVYPFTVADSCSTSPPPPPGDVCYNVAWSHDGRSPDPENRPRCTAPWRPNGTTTLTLEVGSHVPIAGVEGRLRLENPGALSVAGVRAFLPGWQVAYSNDGSGHFIAFAGPGAAPIAATELGSPMPFLRVDVTHNGLLDVVTPDVVHLAAVDLIVSDGTGRGIRGCPVIGIYPGPNVATVCRAVRCDANGDGHSDVRDLVVMINCLSPPSNARLACPVDSLAGTLDCDRNGTFDLDDVFCCVRSMLGGDGPPDSTGGLREAPEIAVRFGMPQQASDGTLEVPLRFGGWSAVAAARLDIAYPDARYELLGVTFADTPASWWTMHDASSGHARLAILDLGALGGVGPVTLGGGETRALLRLRLRDGATAGGELSVASSDFAAGDGIGLTTPNASPRLALAGGNGTGIALSAAWPNPFTGSTAFALTVPTAGALDVAVFAANGRRVATLLRESAATAGVYDLVWDGRQDAGGRAPAGVYFVRVVTGPADTSRKVLYLPGGAR